MKKFFKKLGDILFVVFLVFMAIVYFFLLHGILDLLGIGADGS